MINGLMSKDCSDKKYQYPTSSHYSQTKTKITYQEPVLLLMEMKNRFSVINKLQVVDQNLLTIIDVEDFRSLGYYLNDPVSFYFVLV